MDNVVTVHDYRGHDHPSVVSIYRGGQVEQRGGGSYGTVAVNDYAAPMFQRGPPAGESLSPSGTDSEVCEDTNDAVQVLLELAGGREHESRAPVMSV